MNPAPSPAETDCDPIDHAALRLMLSYVEAECLRIGATDAARHAALAAALMPGSAAAAGQPRAAQMETRRLRGRPLH